MFAVIFFSCSSEKTKDFGNLMRSRLRLRVLLGVSRVMFTVSGHSRIFPVIFGPKIIFSINQRISHFDS